MKDDGRGQDDIAGLVKASRAGDKVAFGRLVRLHQREAMRVALGILGNVEDAADVVQEAFVKAYLGIGTLNITGRFRFWVLKIVANEAVSCHRRARRRATLARLFATAAVWKRPRSPDARKRADDLRVALERAMACLSEKEAEAIGLFGLDGLPHREVARIMGCSTESVRWHVHRARQKLRVLLEEYLT